jgi:hypothetical protein
LDYGWDSSELNVPEDVRCLCEKPKCRYYLIKAKKDQNPNLGNDLNTPKMVKLEKDPSYESDISVDQI